MSSTITQCRPSTSPITSRATATLAMPFGARLVDERQVGVEVLGEALGDLDAAGVGRDDHEVGARVVLAGTRAAPARP